MRRAWLSGVGTLLPALSSGVIFTLEELPRVSPWSLLQLRTCIPLPTRSSPSPDPTASPPAIPYSFLLSHAFSCCLKALHLAPVHGPLRVPRRSQLRAPGLRVQPSSHWSGIVPVSESVSYTWGNTLGSGGGGRIHQLRAWVHRRAPGMVCCPLRIGSDRPAR